MLKDRVALVTGGSTGIGAAIVKALAREGARVAFCYIGEEAPAQQVEQQVSAAGGLAQGHYLDVTDFQAVQAWVSRVREEFGGVDILVNNAGINRDAVIWKMEERQWDEVIATDLKGAFNTIRAVAPIFKTQEGGKIVNISSINGLRGKFGQANYAAAKAGLIGLTKTVAKELGRYQVNVNAVCPGLIATTMIRSMPEEFLEQSRREIVLGRLGTPEDVAEVVLFLVSDKAQHITGEVIKVDGGQYI